MTVKSTENINYTYDAAGNIERDNSRNIIYTYDALNHLTIVTTSLGEEISFKYNGLSQRIVKTIGKNKTWYIYNSRGQLLEEIDKANNKTRDYIYADDGKLVAMLEKSNIYYIHTDHLNAPLLVTDANKNIVWKTSYNPFGRATIEVEQIKLNLRAAGQYADEETGLYYNWNRYYNPELGRYITSDPLGLQAGVNTYIRLFSMKNL